MSTQDQETSDSNETELHHVGIRTGVAGVDDAHREILSLLRSYLDGTGDHDPLEVLRELQQHVLSHFSNEEGVMAAAGYPGLDAHRAKHRKLDDIASTMSVEIVLGGVSAKNLEVSNRALAKRLIEHIKTADADFADFLRSAQDG